MEEVGFAVLMLLVLAWAVVSHLLERFNVPTALVFLEPAAGDPDPDVRKLVRWAIGRCQAAV